MPNDIPDWTQASNIEAGSVTITAGTVQVENAPATQLSQFSPQTQIDSAIGVAASTNVVHPNVAVPVGTHGLMVLTNGGGSALMSATIKGHQTGAVYPGTFTGTGDLLALWSGADTSVDVTYFNDQVSGALSFFLVAVPDAVLTAIVAGTVQLVDASNDILEFLINGTQGGALANPHRIPVTKETADPAPWEAAQFSLGLTNASVPNNGFLTLVAAQPGKRIWVFEIDIFGTTGTTADFLNIQDGGALNMGAIVAYPNAESRVRLYGRPTGVGNDLRLVDPGTGGAAAISVHVAYNIK